MKYYFICPEFGALCHVVFIAVDPRRGSHCVEMRFGNVGSWRERETGAMEKIFWKKGKNQQQTNPHIWQTPAILVGG